jgi:hypothetical protein
VGVLLGVLDDVKVRVGVRLGVRELVGVPLDPATCVTGLWVGGTFVLVAVAVARGVAVALGHGQNDPGTRPGWLASLYVPG